MLEYEDQISGLDNHQNEAITISDNTRDQCALIQEWLDSDVVEPNPITISDNTWDQCILPQELSAADAVGEATFDPSQGVQGQAITSGPELQNHTSGLVNHQNNAETGFSHLPNGEASYDSSAEGVHGQALTTTSGLESQDHMGGLVNHHQDNAETVFSYLPNEAITDWDDIWDQLFTADVGKE